MVDSEAVPRSVWFPSPSHSLLAPISPHEEEAQIFQSLVRFSDQLSSLCSDLGIIVALRNKHHESPCSDELTEIQTGGGACPLCPW